MYKIIGGDGQEYGPVTEADLRKWMAEGRLNAQSLAKGENDADFRPLSSFPEFADALGITAGAYGGPSPSWQSVDWSNRDYELDIGGCISRGWNLTIENAGNLLVSTVLWAILFFIVSGVVNTTAGAIENILPAETRLSLAVQIIQACISNLVIALVMGPLTGGLYYVFIRTIRKIPTGVGDLFMGFQRQYVHLFIGYAVMSLAFAACLFPASMIWLSRMAPVIALSDQAKHGGMTPSQAQQIFPQMWSAFAGCIPVLLICLVPMYYLITNFQFTLPLIIDKEMDFWTAIKTSWRMVHKHWFTVFGLVFLTGLINLVGLCVCCLPVFFTFAFTTAAFMFAYEIIFGESRRV